jgi:regulator of sigma D
LEGKKILNGLNKVNAQITVVQQIENKLKANRTSKSRNPVTGNWEVATLEKITDFDATKELETLKQKKVRLEDELSKINSQAKFTFDLNDTIYTRIYGE